MFFGEQPANSSFPLNRFLKPDCGTKSATSWLQSGRQSLANRVCSAERVVSCPISTSTGPSGPIMLHHQSDSDENHRLLNPVLRLSCRTRLRLAPDARFRTYALPWETDRGFRLALRLMKPLGTRQETMRRNLFHLRQGFSSKV